MACKCQVDVEHTEVIGWKVYYTSAIFVMQSCSSGGSLGSKSLHGYRQA